MEIVVDKAFQGERKASHVRFCCGHWLGVQEAPRELGGWSRESGWGVSLVNTVLTGYCKDK